MNDATKTAAVHYAFSVYEEVTYLLGATSMSIKVKKLHEGSRAIAVQAHVSELRDPRTSTPGEKPDYFRGQVCSPACFAIWAELWPALNTATQPT